jgi:DNA-binding transcriptional MerR regulator
MLNQSGVINIPKLMFTRAEAAQALGLSVVTIDRLTERGLIKPNRATRRPLFSLSELTRFSEVPGQQNGKAAKR